MAQSPIKSVGAREPIAKKLAISIFFLDNSSKTILIDPNTKCKEAVLLILERLMIQKNANEDSTLANYFGLWESQDGETLQRRIRNMETLIDVYDQCAKVVFLVRLYTPEIVSSVDDSISWLLYIQAMHKVAIGLFSLKSIDVERLAALTCHHRYGPYSEVVHTENFLENLLLELVPGVDIGKKTPKEWARNIQISYSSLKDMESTFRADDGYLCYLEQQKHTSHLYGSWQFSASQKASRSLPKRIIISVHAGGIDIIKEGDRSILLSVPLVQLFAWRADKENGNLEIDTVPLNDSHAKHYILQTEKCSEIAELVTDYAQNALRIVAASTPKKE